MKIAIFVFLSAVAYKAAYNWKLYLKTKHYQKSYVDYLNPCSELYLESELEIVPLFKAARLADVSFAVSEQLGNNLVSAVTVNHFANLSRKDPIIIRRTHQCFAQALHTFRQRSLEAFSPLYWMNTILYLPKNIFKYLGLSTNTLAAKLFQLIYWIMTPLLLLLRDNLHQFVLTLLD